MVVIQACERIGLLPGERFGRAQRAGLITRGAVGGGELLDGDGAGSSSRVCQHCVNTLYEGVDTGG
jgi:hypothetical protein